MTLGADTLEEHDQLEVEEDHRIDGGSPERRIAGFDQVTHKGEGERALDMTVEVILWGSCSKGTVPSDAKRRAFVPILLVGARLVEIRIRIIQLRALMLTANVDSRSRRAKSSPPYISQPSDGRPHIERLAGTPESPREVGSRRGVGGILWLVDAGLWR